MLNVLLIVAFGYILKKLKLFKEDHASALISYVINFALPILVFKSMHSLGIGVHLFKITLSAWIVIVLCVVISFVIGKFLRLESETFKSFILASSFGNTAFLGYPITYSYFGNQGLSYAIVYDNLGSFLLVSSLGIAIASAKVSLKPVLSFPPFIGLVSGLVFSFSHLPNFLVAFLDFVSASVLPVILFSLGLSLSFSGVIKNLRHSLTVLFIKMLIAPLLALFVGKALSLGNVELGVTILESSMPTMIMASVIAMRYNLNYSLTFASAGLGIVLGFLWFPVIIKLMS